MKIEDIENAAVTMKESQNYHMSFEDAQDYINKCGFDIPWNDGDVFVDEREITRTIGNVLKWRINSVWHNMNEKPNGMFVILADFGQEEYSLGINLEGMESAKRWAYVSDLLPERKEASHEQ